ncbi:hypothetical protein AN964_01800 [Heyndrickxia shackletonii]|uniref:Uncharacterized protein n=1 Tax=Heyndrickxia shackletonii TaxID=157838 RepID=A0A0Q3TFK6_9BACI|nr:hypothetical protein [Heyndrickxia shackletonii]KQL52401.1 hypothetical protein AN964_01800 [Heyndrickxia shackletonii]NEY99041.1 hypothetical protein [Heyndrickxia shackletonii]
MPEKWEPGRKREQKRKDRARKGKAREETGTKEEVLCPERESSRRNGNNRGSIVPRKGKLEKKREQKRKDCARKGKAREETVTIEEVLCPERESSRRNGNKRGSIVPEKWEPGRKREQKRKYCARKVEAGEETGTKEEVLCSKNGSLGGNGNKRGSIVPEKWEPGRKREQKRKYCARKVEA